jgi:hypothetical protein
MVPLWIYGSLYNAVSVKSNWSRVIGEERIRNDLEGSDCGS